jgi:hypothetical protein
MSRPHVVLFKAGLVAAALQLTTVRAAFGWTAITASDLRRLAPMRSRPYRRLISGQMIQRFSNGRSDA